MEEWNIINKKTGDIQQAMDWIWNTDYQYSLSITTYSLKLNYYF